MNLVGFISTALLSLTLVAAAPMYAQEQREQQEEKGKPAQKEEKKAKPEEKKAQPGKVVKQDGKSAQNKKNSKQEEKSAQQERREPKSQPVQQAHGGGNRIPEERFRANFGREHRFHVSQGDYRDGRRFQYGGYSFGFVDPWPSNWLYTEEVYVVEINGVYYLCNPMYPGVNITLSFAL